jgi:hypothetical protein
MAYNFKRNYLKTQEKCRIKEIILCSKSFNLLDKLKYGFQFITATLLVILSVKVAR